MDKKKVLIGIIIATVLGIIAAVILVLVFNKKEENINVEYVDILETEFLSDVKISDFIKSIDGTLNDAKIDTTKVGKNEIEYTFVNDKNKTIKTKFVLDVKDTIAPVIVLGNTYSKVKDSEDNLLDKIMCADNYDDNPKCEIIGTYDLKKVGTYDLTFKATDSSGNVTTKDFTLKVTAPSPSGGNGSTTTKKTTAFKDIVKEHKNDDTQIGIDVSKWQGDIDFKKLKEAGVEFVIIRVGTANGMNGERILDTKFIQNITNANAVEMPVGLYYYSYANSIEKAVADANWIIEQIKDYKVELPIAFDWENWGNYNKYHLSFYSLTKMADEYLNTLKNAGYDTLLYSSKNYLEKYWYNINHDTWLAHYTSKTNYQGKYSFWQLCNNGRVDGINGDVDIDIKYLKKS